MSETSSWKRYLFAPLALPFLLLILILLPLIFLFFVTATTHAFQLLGLPRIIAYVVFWASLFGSMINIPICKLKSEVPSVKIIEARMFGIRYPVPAIDIGERETILSLNFGGAVIPITISIYELLRIVAFHQYLFLVEAILAVAASSFVIHLFAKPIKGMGIGIPVFIPPLVAVILAVIIQGNMPLVAYVSGTLGVLIGADLMNLGKIKELGSSMASIGGAGTFDGIFIAGLIAVLLVT